MEDVLKLPCTLSWLDSVSIGRRGRDGLYVEATTGGAKTYIALSADSVRSMRDWLNSWLSEQQGDVKAAANPVFVPGNGLGNIPHGREVAKNIRDAAESLLGAFGWCDSPEGDEVWRSIYDRLRELERLAGTGKACGNWKGLRELERLAIPVSTVILNGSIMTVAEAREKLATIEKEAA